jgi:hypothetical protein
VANFNHLTGQDREVDRCADDVVDYITEDFTRRDEKYDVIFQLAGTASPWHCRRALTPTRRFCPE